MVSLKNESQYNLIVLNTKSLSNWQTKRQISENASMISKKIFGFAFHFFVFWVWVGRRHSGTKHNNTPRYTT